MMASQRFDFDYNLSTCILTLNIKDSKRSDLGEYKVVAENIVGKADTACKLFIHEIPSIDETPYVNPDSFKQLEFPLKNQPTNDDDNANKQPALIVKPLEDRECFEGETISFSCEVRGNPKPTVDN